MRTHISIIGIVMLCMSMLSACSGADGTGSDGKEPMLIGNHSMQVQKEAYEAYERITIDRMKEMQKEMQSSGDYESRYDFSSPEECEGMGDSMEGRLKRDICFNEVSDETDDFSLCYKIELLAPEKTYCLERAAYEKGNKSYCKDIPSPSQRQECLDD